MKILFDNYELDNELFESVKQDYVDGGYYEDNIPDDLIYDSINAIKDEELACALDFLEERLDEAENGLLVTGTCGRWNGRFDGGYIADDLESLLKVTKDCVFIKIWEDNGHVYIKCSHHDGTNYVEIKKLSEKGRNFYENSWDMDERILHEKIWKNNSLSNLPHWDFAAAELSY